MSTLSICLLILGSLSLFVSIVGYTCCRVAGLADNYINGGE